jgi:hypothetical protein
METITSLVKNLKSSALTEPQLHSLTLKKSELFSWNHTACVITYNPKAENAKAYLLHEFSHALLGHKEYMQDISLLKMERAAWDKARELAGTFNMTISEDLVESALDTYRDWLHNRSTCPTCSATGIETSKQQYKCVTCHATWHVNEARDCSLRRYTAKKHLT